MYLLQEMRLQVQTTLQLLLLLLVELVIQDPGTYPYGANKDMLARKQLKGTTYTFYSDGFFDRRPIKEASNGNYGVSLGNSNVAYQGVLYFNPDSGTNASVFFPVSRSSE